MSIYAFTLVEDDVKKIEIDEIRQGHKTVWVRAILPDESEVNLLSELTNAPVEEFKEFLEQDERPRLHVSRYLMSFCLTLIKYLTALIYSSQKAFLFQRKM